MNDGHRAKINGQRRRDLDRPLDWVKLWYDTMSDMLNVSARQCQDFIGLCRYLTAHPQLGDFIPDAAGWGKEKCMRTLGIHGKIAADCALFCRENGGIRCTAWPLDDVKQAIEKRKTYSNNRKGKAGSSVQSIDCTIDEQSIEEEEDQEKDKNFHSIPEGGYREPAPESGGGEVFGDGWLDEVMKQHDTTTAAPAPAPSAADESMDTPATLALLNSAISPARAASPRRHRPDNFQQVHDAFSAFMKDAPPDRVKQCAFCFWDAQESVGWVDEQGAPLINWMNRARRYAEACIIEDEQADELVNSWMQRQAGNNEAQ